MVKQILTRLAFGLAVLAAVFGVAQAVNISGTNSQNEFSVFKVGYLRNSVQDTITAFAGGGQTSATQIEAGYARVTTVATSGDSVKLPSCRTGASNTGPNSTATPTGNSTGMMLFVTNAATPNSLNVFPQTGESINALAANAAYAMTTGKTAGFLCSPGGTIWYSVLGG